MIWLKSASSGVFLEASQHWLLVGCLGGPFWTSPGPLKRLAFWSPEANLCCKNTVFLLTSVSRGLGRGSVHKKWECLERFGRFWREKEASRRAWKSRGKTSRRGGGKAATLAKAKLSNASSVLAISERQGEATPRTGRKTIVNNDEHASWFPNNEMIRRVLT